MKFGYRIPRTLRSCFRWKEPNFSSSVLVSAHVPQLYSRTDLTKVLYSLILVRCLVLSALCHICSILFNAMFDRCFLCSMSSLLPSSERTFFDVFHSSECFLTEVCSVLSRLTLSLLTLSVSSIFFTFTGLLPIKSMSSAYAISLGRCASVVFDGLSSVDLTFFSACSR